MIPRSRIALVTGASRGIGAAIADQLAEMSITVVGTATSDNGAAAIDKRLKAKTTPGAGMCLNVTDVDQVAEKIKEITETYGAPTILVNNAGITADNLMLRMSDEDWIKVIETNLNSVFRLSKACLRGMTKAKYGRIVNISSVVGSMGNAGQCNYAASKAGVAGFSRSLAKEVGSRNITVNTIAPGFIDTDMTKVLTEDQKNTMLVNVPLKRFGTPKEIADMVVFLVISGGYITGETIHINGGMYMS
jgi:3-oxoacyl-[acyl-carrier protein] reductase|tara:strand:+ start:23988 stop:24728 length:741 start_codon:yes stop_codon:yes gene_type:complete